jgi:hypothetical protein
MPSTRTRPHDRALLLRILEEGYRRATWSGTNLRGTLRGVDARAAGWRPPHAAHSIDDLVRHCAFWKYRVRHRLLGVRKRSFPLPGSDWFEPADPLTDEQWSADLALLDDEHAALCRALADHPDDLAYDDDDAGRRLVRQVFGIAMHDMYHAGQIALIRAQRHRAHD